MLFSTEVVPVYIPTHDVEVSLPPCKLGSIYLMLAVLSRLRWNLEVVFTLHFSTVIER